MATASPAGADAGASDKDAEGAGTPAVGKGTTGTFTVKRGLAEMLRGGVIMDVVNAEQAKIAEDAGAVAVMALERVPADIRRDGGVARMSDPVLIEGIIDAVTIPVMAKARIGHFAEAQVLRVARRRLHRRVRGPDAGRRGVPHRQVALHRPVRLRRHQPGRGPAPHRRGRRHDPLQGRGRHRQHRRGRPPPARHPRLAAGHHPGRLGRALRLGQGDRRPHRARAGAQGHRPPSGAFVLRGRHRHSG